MNTKLSKPFVDFGDIGQEPLSSDDRSHAALLVRHD
jgi:hypothetical protein